MTEKVALAATDDVALWNHITGQVRDEVLSDLRRHHRPYCNGLTDYYDNRAVRFTLTRWQRICFNVPFAFLWTAAAAGATWWISALTHWSWGDDAAIASRLLQALIAVGIPAAACLVHALTGRVRDSGSFYFPIRAGLGRSFYDYVREARRVIADGVKKDLPVAKQIQRAADDVVAHFAELLDVHNDLTEKFERSSGVVHSSGKAGLKASLEQVDDAMLDTVVDLLSAARIVYAAGQTLESFSALSSADAKTRQLADSRIAEVLPGLLASRARLVDVSTAWQSAVDTVDDINHAVLR